jgi:hypothetical protein
VTKQEFQDGLARLRLAFDLQPIRPEVLLVWYADLRAIGAEEWTVILRRIRFNEERFPANFIRSVKSYQEPSQQRPLELGDLRFTPEDEAAAREFFSRAREIAGAHEMAGAEEEAERREELRRQARLMGVGAAAS